MDTDQLLTFERVVQEGSFSRAAWVLGVAQPSISARIQALERHVGGALFIRNGRSVALTELGVSFLPYARRALEVLEAGVEVAKQVQSGQRGHITIGVLESLSGSFMGTILAQFHAAYPQVDVVVRAGRHERLVELLRDGVVSMALLAWPWNDALNSDLELLLQLRERAVLVAAAQHPLAQQGTISQEQLMAQAKPFLLMHWWINLPTPLAQLIQGMQPIIDVPMETGKHLVFSGVGVGFFPWMQVAAPLAAGHLRELTVSNLAPITRSSALVRKTSSAPLSQAAQLLIQMIREHAQTQHILNNTQE